MEKIELKHLTTYLPYGVKFSTIVKGGGASYGKEFYRTKKLELKNLENVLKLNKKLILKPLSDLTKDNYENILDEFSEVELEHLLSAIHIVLNTDSYLNLITYSQFELLVSNHFDVFGLIEKDLAIDINTL